jgi:hypothetical protein
MVKGKADIERCGISVRTWWSGHRVVRRIPTNRWRLLSPNRLGKVGRGGL